MKEIVLRLFLFPFILFLGQQEIFAQGMAKFTFNNGKEERLSIQTYPLQTDKFVKVIDVKTGEDRKLALDSLRSILVEPNEEITEPSLFIPITVYVNRKIQLKRWVELIYASDYITVFRGIFALGVARNGNSFFYRKDSSFIPDTYYYVQRLGENYASVWFFHHTNMLTNNISKSEHKRFTKQSIRYFEHTPKLKKRIRNKEFGPADWKKLIKAYEKEVQGLTKTEDRNYNI